MTNWAARLIFQLQLNQECCVSLPALLEDLVSRERVTSEARQPVGLQPCVLDRGQHLAPRAIDASDRSVDPQAVPRIERELLAEFLLRCAGKGLRIDVYRRSPLPVCDAVVPRDERVFDRLSIRVVPDLQCQVQAEMIVVSRIEQVLQALQKIMGCIAWLAVLGLA